MSIYYLDTSAIVKLYVDEPGTEVMDRLFDGIGSDDRFYTSWLSILELTSVILRLAKGGRLTPEAADPILARFRNDIEETIQLWPLDDSVLSAALAGVEQHTLRSGDAIHLATAAFIFRLAAESETVLVSSDRELLEAATQSGMGVLNPQDQDT